MKILGSSTQILYEIFTILYECSNNRGAGPPTPRYYPPQPLFYWFSTISTNSIISLKLLANALESCSGTEEPPLQFCLWLALPSDPSVFNEKRTLQCTLLPNYPPCCRLPFKKSFGILKSKKIDVEHDFHAFHIFPSCQVT